MSDIIRFIDGLNDEQLFELEKDIKSGTLQKFIDQKKEYFKVKDKTCSVCGNSLGEDCLVLIYGDPKVSLRKKAHFCGTDCMEYFVNKNIRKLKDAKINKQKRKREQK